MAGWVAGVSFPEGTFWFGVMAVAMNECSFITFLPVFLGYFLKQTGLTSLLIRRNECSGWPGGGGAPGLRALHSRKSVARLEGWGPQSVQSGLPVPCKISMSKLKPLQAYF
jgi:hypothetical protein